MIDDDVKKIPERLEKPVLNDGILMDVMNRYYNGPIAPTIPFVQPFTVPTVYQTNTNSPVSPGSFLANPSAEFNNSESNTSLANPFQTTHLGGSKTNTTYRKKRNNQTRRKRRYKLKNRTYSRRV